MTLSIWVWMLVLLAAAGLSGFVPPSTTSTQVPIPGVIPSRLSHCRRPHTRHTLWPRSAFSHIKAAAAASPPSSPSSPSDDVPQRISKVMNRDKQLLLLEWAIRFGGVPEEQRGNLRSVEMGRMDNRGFLLTCAHSQWGEFTVQVEFREGECPDTGSLEKKLCDMSEECGGSLELDWEDLNKPVAVQLPTALNSVPHTRDIRFFFYNDVSQAVLRAVSDGRKKRMKVTCLHPETNPAMDTYRVGTTLEMVRQAALALKASGLKTLVTVQGSMGEGIFAGMPLSLSGVSRIMESMDWGAGEPGDSILLSQMVSGAASQASDVPQVVGDESPLKAGVAATVAVDAIFVVCPTSIVGNSVQDPLQEMMAAAVGNPGVLLFNPRLEDVQSSGGVMSVRGRQDRLDFQSSFEEVYHFRLCYRSRTLFYPILGAVRMSYPGPWAVHKLHVQLQGQAETRKALEQWEVKGECDSAPDSQLLTKWLG